MHEQDLKLSPPPPNSQQMPETIADIEQKQFSAAVLKNEEDIQRYIETPAIPAVTTLWKNNVPSVQSSANLVNTDGTPTAWIDFDYDSLSDANQAVIDQSDALAEYAEADGRRIVKLGFDMSDMTPEDVSSGLQRIAERFEPQTLVRGVHTVEDVARMYYCDPEEVTAEFIAETGMVLGEDDRIYESPELHQNQQDFESKADYLLHAT